MTVAFGVINKGSNPFILKIIITNFIITSYPSSVA